jgi:hypothetical protein
MSNPRRKYPMKTQKSADPVEAAPDEITIRLGLRPVATSKGRSDGSNRIVVPGATISLPRHEAENLLNLGYASHV